MSAVAESPLASDQFRPLGVGGDRFLIDETAVLAVDEHLIFRSHPGLPDWALEAATVRDLLPAIDLRQLLGDRPPPITGRLEVSPSIIVVYESASVALVVDWVGTIDDGPIRERTPNPPTARWPLRAIQRNRRIPELALNLRALLEDPETARGLASLRKLVDPAIDDRPLG